MYCRSHYKASRAPAVVPSSGADGFHPVDYVVFDGMKDRDRPMKAIILLDRKASTPDHRKVQRSIEKTIEKGRYEWKTLRVRVDGGVEEE